jgi:hypothetical protein
MSWQLAVVDCGMNVFNAMYNPECCMNGASDAPLVQVLRVPSEAQIQSAFTLLLNVRLAVAEL